MFSSIISNVCQTGLILLYHYVLLIYCDTFSLVVCRFLNIVSKPLNLYIVALSQTKPKSLQDKGTVKSVTAGKRNFLKLSRQTNGKYVSQNYYIVLLCESLL